MTDAPICSYVLANERNQQKQGNTPQSCSEVIVFLGEDPVIYPRDDVLQHSVALRDSSSQSLGP